MKRMRPVATLRFARLLRVGVLVLVGAVARADAQQTVSAPVRAELQARAGRYPLVAVTVFARDSALIVFKTPRTPARRWQRAPGCSALPLA
jgi:hypothetical protein